MLKDMQQSRTDGWTSSRCVNVAAKQYSRKWLFITIISGVAFFKVTLPLLGPSMTTCVFMSLTNGLKVFDIILALTKGGPGRASYSATLQIYNEAFTNNNFGLGSAEAILYFLFVLVITQLVLKGMSRKEVDL